MTSNSESPTKKKAKKKKKTDPFWPIVIILSILAFTGSFWFFYMLTSHINTRNFPTTDTPKLMLSPSPDNGLTNSSVQLGDTTKTTTTQASPAPNKSAALISAAPASTLPSSSAAAKSPTPVATLAPTAAPTAAPQTPASAPASAATAEKTTYRVHVGSYATRDEAQQVATQLGNKGYAATVIDDNGRFRVQLGVMDSQQNALALAEEITQQGYEVVVRKGSP